MGAQEESRERPDSHAGRGQEGEQGELRDRETEGEDMKGRCKEGWVDER